MAAQCSCRQLPVSSKASTHHSVAKTPRTPIACTAGTLSAASLISASLKMKTTTTADIGKASATITVTPYSLTYDGRPHTATGTAKGVNGQSLAGLDLSGTTHTSAGNYNDTWTFTDVTGNYNNATGAVTDLIPAKYNTKSDLTFDVPSGGTDKADFPLTTK